MICAKLVVSFQLITLPFKSLGLFNVFESLIIRLHLFEQKYSKNRNIVK